MTEKTPCQLPFSVCGECEGRKGTEIKQISGQLILTITYSGMGDELCNKRSTLRNLVKMNLPGSRVILGLVQRSGLCRCNRGSGGGPGAGRRRSRRWRSAALLPPWPRRGAAHTQARPDGSCPAPGRGAFPCSSHCVSAHWTFQQKKPKCTPFTLKTNSF